MATGLKPGDEVDLFVWAGARNEAWWHHGTVLHKEGHRAVVAWLGSKREWEINVSQLVRCGEDYPFDKGSPFERTQESDPCNKYFAAMWKGGWRPKGYKEAQDGD